jgi:ribosomal protein S18 acetylase RimI-like enzyme
VDPTAEVGIRFSDTGDVSQVAALHADSWRRHYRGAYSDRYLDGDLDADRLSVWTQRLGRVLADRFTLVAERGGSVVGFAHALLDADATWGALVENLHVSEGLHRRGIGSRLLAGAAQVVIDRRSLSPIYLSVQEQNRAAQQFYLARNGILGDREPVSPPGGDLRNLDGTPYKIRVSWPDPTALLIHS